MRADLQIVLLRSRDGSGWLGEVHEWSDTHKRWTPIAAMNRLIPAPTYEQAAKAAREALERIEAKAMSAEGARSL